MYRTLDSILEFEGCSTAGMTSASWFAWDFPGFLALKVPPPAPLSPDRSAGHFLVLIWLVLTWLDNYNLIGWIVLYGKIPTKHIPIFSNTLAK